VWFPLWPIQRLRSAQPEVRNRPLALYAATARGERITACSPRAARLGLRPGMTRPEAEVLAGSIPLLPADVEADRARLMELALLCHSRFSPMTALEETGQPECLLLDIDGCAHLFAGEQGLMREVVQFFRSQHWQLRCALADTVGTAWALAHSAPRSITIAPVGQGEAVLRPLPVRSLRLPADDLAILFELGIERVEQLLMLPRAELTSRFDPIVPRRLRQALGIEPEMLVPVRAADPIVARWDSENPVSDQAAVEHFCEELLASILKTCQERGLGLLQCLCRLVGHQDTASYIVELVRPSTDCRHLLGLLELQWERRAFPEGIQSIRVEATRIQRIDRPSGLLFEIGRTSDRRATERLVERLSSRLGKERVLQASLSADAQPEFAVAWRPWLEARPASAPRKKPHHDSPREPAPWERPFILQAPSPLKVWSVVPDGPPQRVEWHRQLRAVVRWWGPERIETGWWSRQQCHRDYYRVELETGEWLWIFRTQGTWHLQGMFD
jgi:protein ImuB